VPGHLPDLLRYPGVWTLLLYYEVAHLAPLLPTPLVFRSVTLSERSEQFAVCDADKHSITTSGTTTDSDEFGMNPGRISDISRTSGGNS
jgi:hypothetical protein